MMGKPVVKVTPKPRYVACHNKCGRRCQYTPKPSEGPALTLRAWTDRAGYVPVTSSPEEDRFYCQLCAPQFRPKPAPKPALPADEQARYDRIIARKAAEKQEWLEQQAAIHAAKAPAIHARAPKLRDPVDLTPILKFNGTFLPGSPR